jgi:kynurenine 3-monooxygenase
MNSNSPKISIVGAGLVGSLFSCFLAKRGYKVDVYERRQDMRKANISAGKSINLAMSTRGWTALEKAGLKEKMEPLAIPMYSRMIHQQDGSVVTQAYGKEGEAIYSISRGDLNKIMMEVAEKEPNVNFHFNKKCTNVDFKETTLSFKDYKTNEELDVKSDLIFAADGAFSAVRYNMQKVGRFNFSQSYLEHGYKELEIPAGLNGTHRIPRNHLHIWPREGFMLIALPNLDGSFTMTLFLAFKGKYSFDNLQKDQEIKDFFETHFPTAIEHMPNYLADFHNNPTSSLSTIKTDPWFHNNVALLGDSAHGIVPFYGQGMNSGFEDCRIMDELIDKHEGNNWDKILQEYSDIRVENGQAIADLAVRHFINMRDDTQDDNFLKRKAFEKIIMKNVPEFLPQYSMVSFSNIPYAVAMNKGDDQIKMLESLLFEYPNETDWEKEEVFEKVRKFLREY